MLHLQTSQIDVQCGYIISLYRNDNKFSPIAWKSIETIRVVKSTLPTETLSLEQVLESCYMITSLIYELINKDMTQNILPIKCYVDNKSLLNSAFSTKTITENRLEIDMCTIHEMIAK